MLKATTVRKFSIIGERMDSRSHCVESLIHTENILGDNMDHEEHIGTCPFCNADTTMVTTSQYTEKHYDNGGYVSSGHDEVSITQCTVCKMIQPSED